MNESVSSSFPRLNEVEKIIGYEFKNKELLKEAFTHNSYKDDNCRSYERLEYLGDSFLNHIYNCQRTLFSISKDEVWAEPESFAQEAHF
ncbi:ribonuclease III [Artemisia annua]|uniref:Ribonuclease III n=1 Tax=Artemisia annua TaxID=35608 RepID=A0A2U1KJC3_ARTAN|nr:ribonuclease III [Artemisia annua]